jgi:membrane-associated phospholipid phosphatase
MKRVMLCLLLLATFYTTPVGAADNLFNSGAAIRDEVSRVADEGKLFVTGPVDPYLAGTAVVAGSFAAAYVFDEDIRNDLRGVHNGTLTSLTDIGNVVGNPFVHIGAAAALYTAGVLADAPPVMRLSEEIGEALFLADGATFVLREAIGRARPETGSGNATFRPFQFKSDYDSLPSMHTASSFALAHVFASKTDSLAAKILCYSAASFVGFSRMYQNKHWASDVVLGAAIGELAGASVTRYYASRTGAVTLAPVAIDGTPALALVGRF